MNRRSNGRLVLYLVMTFGITWVAWWPLASLIPAGASVFSNPTFSALYIAGGLGPTLAALIAVALTPREGSLHAYAASLTRWRVPLAWYLVAFLLPPIWRSRSTFWPHGSARNPPPFRRFTTCRAVPLIFLTMILGGGLEELGWRGVAQPMLERRFNRITSAAIVGVLWALWHLPLFFIHGVPQYGADFHCSPPMSWEMRFCSPGYTAGRAAFWYAFCFMRPTTPPRPWGSVPGTAVPIWPGSDLRRRRRSARR